MFDVIYQAIAALTHNDVHIIGEDSISLSMEPSYNRTFHFSKNMQQFGMYSWN